MARRRDYSAETARRNELARERGYSSYYAERIARAERTHKGISRRAARGHPSREERTVASFLKFIRSQPDEAQVAFTSLDRQPDGTFKRGRFDVLYLDRRGNPKERTFIIDGKVLTDRMDEIAETIATSIGQGFLGWGSP